MRSAVRNRVRPIAHGSRHDCLAGWSTVTLRVRSRTTVWRAGRRAGALTATLHAGSGTCAAGSIVRPENEKARRLEVASPFASRLRWSVLGVCCRRAAHQVGPSPRKESMDERSGGVNGFPENVNAVWLVIIAARRRLRAVERADVDSRKSNRGVNARRNSSSCCAGPRTIKRWK